MRGSRHWQRDPRFTFSARKSKLSGVVERLPRAAIAKIRSRPVVKTGVFGLEVTTVISTFCLSKVRQAWKHIERTGLARWTIAPCATSRPSQIAAKPTANKTTTMPLQPLPSLQPPAEGTSLFNATCECALVPGRPGFSSRLVRPDCETQFLCDRVCLVRSEVWYLPVPRLGL
jgi:hypothetical protein